MNSSKILHDIVNSAAGAKAHFDIWWAQVSDSSKPEFVSTMNKHSEFFLASQDAHYIAFFVYFSQMFDKDNNSSSLASYLKSIRNSTNPVTWDALFDHYNTLLNRARPIIFVRNKTVAHIDTKLNEKSAFGNLNITWSEIRSTVYDSAEFVTALSGSSNPSASCGFHAIRTLSPR